MAEARLKLDGVPAWQVAWLGSHRNPWLFATGVLGILPYGAPNPDPANVIQLEKWQDEFLRPENFFTDPDGKPSDNPRHSVRAGHGVGKGFVIAILGLWFVCCHEDAKSVLTANSQDQLRDNNWPELKKVGRMLPEALRAQLQIDEERIYVKHAPELAFIVRRTASRSNPEALQGIHAKHVLYLIDEASGIFEMVFEVAQGSLSTKGAIACLFSNPTKPAGFFFDTHNKLRAMWKCRRVSSEDVPRARGHIEDIIKAYGKDSNRYRVRVMGEFPTKGDDTVIPLELVEAAKGRQIEVSDVYPVWGLDVARFGDDRTVLTKRMGKTLLEPPIIWKNLNSTQIAGRVLAEYAKTMNDMRPEEVCIDVIGYGSGVIDQLDKDGSALRGKITSVNVSENAAVDPENHRLRDELWWKGRQWFEAMDCSIPATGCEDLIVELTAPTYDFTDAGKRIVARKKDMKKDIGWSPDIADSFLLTLAAGVYPREPERHRRIRRSEGARDPWAS
jgi:phage terminase large subunit